MKTGNMFFKSDKYGFRNENENYLDQNFLDGKMPILIGDSFGLGVCIQNELYLKNIKKGFKFKCER